MSKQTLVMKFGGTSVGSTDALTKVKEIIQEALNQWKRIVVVTGAEHRHFLRDLLRERPGLMLKEYWQLQ